jgi:hypothetical protein
LFTTWNVVALVTKVKRAVVSFFVVGLPKTLFKPVMSAKYPNCWAGQAAVIEFTNHLIQNLLFGNSTSSDQGQLRPSRNALAIFGVLPDHGQTGTHAQVSGYGGARCI